MMSLLLHTLFFGFTGWPGPGWGTAVLIQCGSLWEAGGGATLPGGGDWAPAVPGGADTPEPSYREQGGKCLEAGEPGPGLAG